MHARSARARNRATTAPAPAQPLNWPMTHVVLEGRVPSVDTVALKMRFDPAFAFEEPIALTMQNADRARRMTRWLVAGQVSPQFTLYAPGASQPAATFRPTFDADAVGDAGADPMSLLQYVHFGWTHIVPLGWDHVLFVLGLYFGAPTWRRLLLLISVFTVAHSLSLLMAAAAWVRFSPAWVEPLIAASIVWVTVDNLRAAPKRRARLPIVFGFGLLHLRLRQLVVQLHQQLPALDPVGVPEVDLRHAPGHLGAQHHALARAQAADRLGIVGEPRQLHPRNFDGGGARRPAGRSCGRTRLAVLESGGSGFVLVPPGKA